MSGKTEAIIVTGLSGVFFISCGIYLVNYKDKHTTVTKANISNVELSSEYDVLGPSPDIGPSPEETVSDRRSEFLKKVHNRRKQREIEREEREERLNRFSQIEDYQTQTCSTQITTTINGNTVTENNNNCITVAEYTVNGENYYIEVLNKSDRDKTEIEVSYDPDNPSDSSFPDKTYKIIGWSSISLGIILLLITFLIYYFYNNNARHKK